MDCESAGLSARNLLTNASSYPYPLFAVLDTTQRLVLFTGAAILMTGSTVMLRRLYEIVNGLEGSEKRSTPSNIKGE